MARLNFLYQDSAGNGIPGKTLTLHHYVGGTLIGTLTDAGLGLYYIDYTVTEKVLLKDGGTLIAATNGQMFVAEDVATLPLLAATTALQGSWLIGHADVEGRWDNSTLAEILQNEVPSLADLASLGSGRGAALIGIRDAEEYFAAETVEDALQEIYEMIANFALLDDLSAVTAGKGASLVGVQDSGLHYTGATVEAVLAEIGATLGLLTTGLPTLTLANGGLLTGADAASTPLYNFKPGKNTTTGDRGAFVFDLRPATGGQPGHLQVTTATGTYDVVTTELFGDLDFTGHRSLGGITGANKLTNVLRYLGDAAFGYQRKAGIPKEPIWTAAQEAGDSPGAEASDPTTIVVYTEIAATYKVKLRRKWTQMPEHRWLRAALQAFCTTAKNGLIKLTVDTINDVETTVDTVFTQIDLAVDLAALPVTVPTERTITLELATTDGTSTVEINAQSDIWAEVA